MGEALVVRHLSKRFGGLRAVEDLSFSVSENETVALIGPNGAGKTTCFNLLTKPAFIGLTRVRYPRSAARSWGCGHTTFAGMAWRVHFRWRGRLAE